MIQEIAFQDETFDINRSSNYYLLIQLSPDGITAVVLDSERDKYIWFLHKPVEPGLAIEVYQDEVVKILSAEDIFTKEFKQVRCLLCSPKSVLVPDALFQEKTLKHFFEFNHPMDDLDEIHYDKLDEINAFNVYTIHNQLSHSLNKQFNKPLIVHQGSILIRRIYKNAGSSISQVNVSIHNNFFDIAVVHFGKLKLFNSFFYQDQNDLTYYIMNVYKQLFLDHQKMPLVISGGIQTHSEHYQLIEKYIRTIKTEKLDNKYSFSYTFNKIDTHLFLNLYSLANCVS
jgi:hypothetical protein